ncbi:MAG: amidohydrolase [Gemmataceae bacterium]|nr:amidohydrolase [Gemmataceae bacterium]
MDCATLSREIYQEICAFPILDPHSHINPHSPASKSLDDILGYHYYTELAFSAGMKKTFLTPEADPRERVREIIRYMSQFDNTAQYSWFLEIAREFLGFEGNKILPEHANWLWDTAEKKMAAKDWERQVLNKSRLERIFLTNDFDDPLTGWDTSFYVPCLRTDELVFHFGANQVRPRLENVSGINPGSAKELDQSLNNLFQHFVSRGCRACAISLPPDFHPEKISDDELDRVFRAGDFQSPTWKQGVFWKLAECCAAFQLPFDLMIGVNRKVFQNGVFQGQDLFDQRTSLIQYAGLFNAFPTVPFCISVLTSNQNQELASYSWIFPNVITSGHWWYSNIPAYIEQDARARLQAVPKTKQIGYYSDMYKLEFGLPKFNMYRKILAGILARDFVQPGALKLEEALNLARLVLRGNSERIFKIPATGN